MTEKTRRRRKTPSEHSRGPQGTGTVLYSAVTAPREVPNEQDNFLLAELVNGVQSGIK